jgi:hypothetical protein
MTKEIIFVTSGQVVYENSKINWPDLNRPNSGETTLRYLHTVDYDNKRIQLDGCDGPVFENGQLPAGVGFYRRA